MARTVKYIKRNKPRMTEVHKLKEGDRRREGERERGRWRESEGSLRG